MKTLLTGTTKNKDSRKQL